MNVMKINEDLSNLFYAMGISDTEGIHSYNRYLGKLYELKLELEDALEICENEITKVMNEKKQF